MFKKDISKVAIVLKGREDIDVLTPDGDWGTIILNPDTDEVRVENYSPRLTDYFKKKPTHDDIFGDFMAEASIETIDLGEGTLEEYYQDGIDNIIGDDKVEVCTIERRSGIDFVIAVNKFLFDKQIPSECKFE